MAGLYKTTQHNTDVLPTTHCSVWPVVKQTTTHDTADPNLNCTVGIVMLLGTWSLYVYGKNETTTIQVVTNPLTQPTAPTHFTFSHNATT